MVPSDSSRPRKRTFSDFLSLVEATPLYVDPPDSKTDTAPTPDTSLPAVGGGGGGAQQVGSQTKNDPTGAAEQSGANSVAPVGATINDPITNVEVEFDNGKPKTVPLPISEIIRRIHAAADNWPRKHAGQLFVHEPGQPKTDTLRNTPALFSWLGQKFGIIDFRKLSGCPTKEEVFQGMLRMAQEYVSIEEFPHYPRIQNHYYMCGDYPDSDGAALSELLDRFYPETQEDRSLILAMFASVFWGGRGGQRPAFVIVSDSGRGAGKSKITDILAYLSGGLIDLSHKEDAEIMKQRLLSPEGRLRRIARLDNVKSHNFSWSDLESIITAQSISGKQLHVGEGSRPNTLTWVITFNAASFSTDMAQRSVIIKILKPKRSDNWEAETIKFIDANREQIISDLLTFLKLPAKKLHHYTRWAAWESEVLSRLPDPDLVQAVIADRAGVSDVEGEEIELIEHAFHKNLEDYEMAPHRSKIHIPSNVAGKWYNEATGEKRSVMGACKRIRQFISETRSTCLADNPNRSRGRGLLWIGPECEADEEVDYDLEIKIAEKKNGRRW